MFAPWLVRVPVLSCTQVIPRRRPGHLEFCLVLAGIHCNRLGSPSQTKTSDFSAYFITCYSNHSHNKSRAPLARGGNCSTPTAPIPTLGSRHPLAHASARDRCAQVLKGTKLIPVAIIPFPLQTLCDNECGLYEFTGVGATEQPAAASVARSSSCNSTGAPASASPGVEASR